MKSITEELLKTHLVVSTVLEKLEPESPRFREITETLHRTFFVHGWIQDAVLAPVLENRSPMMTALLQQIQQSHKEIERSIKGLLDCASYGSAILKPLTSRLRAAIEKHFERERDAFFPLVETVLDPPTLLRLAEEAEGYRTEAGAASLAS